ncbi:unnamed protein product, partial [Amoebophrya sp. A25]|eukprot:GSA25T00012656001.1
MMMSLLGRLLQLILLTQLIKAQPIHHAPQARAAVGLQDSDSLPKNLRVSYIPSHKIIRATSSSSQDSEDARAKRYSCPIEAYRLSSGGQLHDIFGRYRELLFDIYRVRDSSWYLEHWELRNNYAENEKSTERLVYPEYLGGEEPIARLKWRNQEYDRIRRLQKPKQGFLHSPQDAGLLLGEEQAQLLHSADRDDVNSAIIASGESLVAEEPTTPTPSPTSTTFTRSTTIRPPASTVEKFNLQTLVSPDAAEPQEGDETTSLPLT